VRFQLLEFAKISNTKHNNVRFDPLRISLSVLEYISSVLKIKLIADLYEPI
jgi:hypothetical protein